MKVVQWQLKWIIEQHDLVIWAWLIMKVVQWQLRWIIKQHDLIIWAWPIMKIVQWQLRWIINKRASETRSSRVLLPAVRPCQQTEQTRAQTPLVYWSTPAACQLTVGLPSLAALSEGACLMGRLISRTDKRLVREHTYGFGYHYPVTSFAFK